MLRVLGCAPGHTHLSTRWNKLVIFRSRVTTPSWISLGRSLDCEWSKKPNGTGGAVAKRHADVVPVRPRLTQVPELLGALVHACRELGRNQHLEHAGWQHRDGGVRGDGHARVHALLDAVHHLVLAAERRRVDVVQVQHCTRAVAQSKRLAPATTP